MTLSFRRLNHSWNAEPNAPEVRVAVHDAVVEVSFLLNAWQFSGVSPGERATIRFNDCVRYRLDPTNDEGWYRGKGRYARVAPDWGEFYEIVGETEVGAEPADWIETGLGTSPSASRHFLFYFRDEAFECFAQTCEVERTGQPKINL